VQYHIVKLLAKGGGNIFVVGDDDQSIYGWRGADITNILDFGKDFPGARIVRLEQNYRSHQHILDAADGVINNNIGRMGKKLWSSTKTGQKPLEFAAESDLEEAQFVAEKAASLIREGKYAADDIAVLYRMNSQSRVIENKLKERSLPYKIYGGQSFYERKEIKDLLAYLNLLCNPAADVCFMRAIGVPRRGIGDVTLGKLLVAARSRRVSLMQASLDSDEILPEKAKGALRRFAGVLADIRAKMNEQTVLDTIEQVFKASGLLENMQSDTTPDGRMRLLNIEEFFKSAADFIRETPPPHSLEAFLERNALISGTDAAGSDEGNITLTTLHGAKGLEFPIVFIVGLEEGLLPHNLSLMDGSLEEERRLCYVGMTRTKKRLYLTWSRTRYVRAAGGFERVPSRRSRFLDEVPHDCIETAGVKRHTNQYLSREPASQSAHSFAHGQIGMPLASVSKKAQHEPSEFRTGKAVSHPKFGNGRIISTNGEGNEKIAVVRFDSEGEKKMFVAFAPLKLI
ncbi:MAG: 3'-5' exonuclease, partial [Christensenellales bacterium]